jgi:hypothetical protein
MIGARRELLIGSRIIGVVIAATGNYDLLAPAVPTPTSG